jgi:hypothetical protein
MGTGSGEETVRLVALLMENPAPIGIGTNEVHRLSGTRPDNQQTYAIRRDDHGGR